MLIKKVHQSSQSKWLYFTMVLASTFLQGSSFVATKLLLATMSPLWLAGIRFLIAALSLLPFLLYRYQIKAFAIPQFPIWVKLIAIGFFQTAGVMIFLNIGLQYTTPATAAIIMASNPLLVAILAKWLLGEMIGYRAMAGLLLAFVGVVICIGLTQSAHLGKGEVFIILASVSWALATIINKKSQLSVNPWIVTFWQMLIGSLLIILVASFSQQPFNLPNSSYGWAVLVWLAIPASTIAMGLWFAALDIGGATHTSGFLFLCPLFSALLSYLILGTQLSLQEIIGGSMIGIGIYLLSRYRQ